MSGGLRVGLVGVGIISETHLAVLGERGDVALEFAVDPRLEGPLVFRGEEVPSYGEPAGALAAHEVDLVVIATPTDTHAELAVQALTLSAARVLVEKPLVHDLASLDRLRALDEAAGVPGRVFTAYHFAFSPEVLWAAGLMAEHPEWGPVTNITSAFYDPYVARGEQAFASYLSSWMDSGVNQLSMLARFVDLTALTSVREMDGGAAAWCTCEFLSRGERGLARLRTSWLAGSSSKETVLTFARSGVEIWIDHTAMTGFAAREGALLAAHGDDGRTPRKVAHYRPLYESLLSGRPDPVMSFATAARITELHHTAPAR
ncbi:Gfo/Idh/MocA family oxidoreductase [Sphaerisporangium sp. TRM90804]|uniref:Gfo/Idh/MocA family protein n=1 Tax=Sphaerisporangium sp. TRM90804 TaxID=3031113 RepID=UPI002449EE41|nr:Gfo/Idh/MocA family oxidoreductase [Sphaerisporangium sp. TRM90804]MDH2424341.1 Gfo/Idh/MocA family oxidoreductase [Sphaerisporangium sp. TRM90804]